MKKQKSNSNESKNKERKNFCKFYTLDVSELKFLNVRNPKKKRKNIIIIVSMDKKVLYDLIKRTVLC